MTQAATIACRYSKWWYAVHEHQARRSGKPAAKVAVARRLLIVAFYLLNPNQPYQQDYKSKHQAAIKIAWRIILLFR